MQNRKIIVIGLILIMVVSTGLFAAGRRADGQTFNLKMSTQQADTAPIVAGFRAWSEAVKQRTNGNFVIEVFTVAALGTDEDVIEQALQGANVAVLTDGARMANYVRDIGIVGMPYIANDYDELLRITETATFQSWDALLVREGIRILSYNWYDGPRNFWTNREIRTPADLNGMRIRTPGAPVWARSVASLGATPVAMPWNDAYNAMQTRVIDGVEVQSTSAFPSRTFEVARIMTRTEHFQLANFIMCGERWFSTLPVEIQRILVEECKKASIENARQILAASRDFENRMVANHGVTINEVNKAPFIAAAERAYDELNFREARDRLWREIGKR